MPGYELIGDEELAEVKEVFEKSRILFRHGFDQQRNGVYKVRDFEAAFAKRMGVAHALGVTSGTAALRVALAALGIGDGDEVITQCFTFVATVEAIIESRSTPICTEVNETLNMCPRDLARRITPKTKAIIVVHMLGVPAELDEISEIARRHNIPIIEDTAWGCGGSYGDKPLGSIGSIGTYSFDFAKTMTTGEGGMLVCNDDTIAARARAWHDHGHENNPSVPRWEDTRTGSGFNYRMMELQGAIGLAQLKKLDGVVHEQQKNAALIMEGLKGLPLEFRHVPETAVSTADALIFFVADGGVAKRCRERLMAHGLGTKILPEAFTWHFAGTWDHMPELVQAHNGSLAAAFPRSVRLLERAVSIPISLRMPDGVALRVRAAIEEALVG